MVLRRWYIPGHCWVLHLSVTSRGGQGSPPYCGCSNTCLVVVFVPLPHVTLQSLHGSQVSTSQSTLKEKLKGEITHLSLLQSIERPQVGKTLSFQKRKITFTWVSVARLLFPQSWTASSSNPLPLEQLLFLSSWFHLRRLHCTWSKRTSPQLCSQLVENVDCKTR